jgi:hypothetical protein
MAKKTETKPEEPCTQCGRVHPVMPSMEELTERLRKNAVDTMNELNALPIPHNKDVLGRALIEAGQSFIREAARDEGRMESITAQVVEVISGGSLGDVLEKMRERLRKKQKDMPQA